MKGNFIIKIFLIGLLIFLLVGIFYKYQLLETYTYGKKIKVRVTRITDECEKGSRSTKNSRIIFFAKEITSSNELEVLSEWISCCNIIKEGDIIDVVAPKNKFGRCVYGDLSIKSEFIFLVIFTLLLGVCLVIFLRKK